MELDIEILFIDELLVISESRTVTYSWMGGIRRIGKLKINGIVSQSVVSGSTQESEFWADLLTVSSSLETLNSFDIMSSSEEKTPTVSSDQDATGETTTSFKSEEEKEAHLDEIECNAIMGMLNILRERNPEAYRDVLIETLYKHFARENRATRSMETIFSELDKLEARETEYYETSGRVPNGLQMDLKFAREDVEFENYVTLLKEARAQFGRVIEGAVILYIEKHKGESYCLSCMSRRDK